MSTICGPLRCKTVGPSRGYGIAEMKILVIDDSGFARRVVRRCMHELGHEVIEASSGEHGLERYVLTKPDFVILDLVMPGIGGLEVLVSLRAVDPAARVIICSADVQSSTRDEMREAGAAAMINKPVSIEQLAATLNVVLGNQNAWPDRKCEPPLA
jgi:two-component system, chemotaxis family, chemotaxis protein CheY